MFQKEDKAHMIFNWKENKKNQPIQEKMIF